jgi:hypothetical protein
MKLNRIKSIRIVKEKPKGSTSKLTKQIEYKKFVEYIEANKDFYEWQEESENGKKYWAALVETNVPLTDPVFTINLNKHVAYAMFDKKKGYELISVDYNYEFGLIGFQWQTKLTKELMLRFLDMADYCEGLVYVNSAKILNREAILALEVPEKKVKKVD